MLLSNDAGVAKFWHGRGLLLRTSYYIYNTCVGGKKRGGGGCAIKKRFLKTKERRLEFKNIYIYLNVIVWAKVLFNNLWKNIYYLDKKLWRSKQKKKKGTGGYVNMVGYSKAQVKQIEVWHFYLSFRDTLTNSKLSLGKWGKPAQFCCLNTISTFSTIITKQVHVENNSKLARSCHGAKKERIDRITK